jgi:hypothetical protein
METPPSTDKHEAELPKARVIYYTSYTNANVDADIEVDGIRAVSPKEILSELPHILVIGGPIQHSTKLAKPLLQWLKNLDKQAGKSGWDGSILLFFTHQHKAACDVAIGNTKQMVRDLKHLQEFTFKKMIHLHVAATKGPLEAGYEDDIETVLVDWLASIGSKMKQKLEQQDKAAKDLVDSVEAKITSQGKQQDAQAGGEKGKEEKTIEPIDNVPKDR